MSDGERGRLNSTRSLLCFNSGNRDSSLDTCRFLELPLGFLGGAFASFDHGENREIGKKLEEKWRKVGLK